MSSDATLTLANVGKFYEIYEKPRDRLWQMLWRGRRKFYREYWACANINLSVFPGQCLGIVGRNGAGKSTLLQLMAGAMQPSTGSIAVNGRVAALLELGSGFNPEFTGRENVFLNAAILGLSQAEIDERYSAICAFADIGDFIDRPIKTYSSGMALRLAFAVMAHVSADILIIDEALAVGDAFFTARCMRFLREFMARHTVVFVSHDINAVCSLCTHAALMEAGRISLLGSPADVAKKYLESLYEESQGDAGMKGIGSPGACSCQDAGDNGDVDMRQELIKHSNLRNDLEIFKFNPGADAFGAGKGRIIDVALTNDVGNKASWIVGGENVRLRIVCAIDETMVSPIVGFMVLNRFGQQLFGDNTWLTCAERPLTVAGGDELVAEFAFRMPILAPGEYHITAALGEGTPQKHVQHHWIHEAVAFTSHSSSLACGMMGIPMQNISLTRAGSQNCGE